MLIDLNHTEMKTPPAKQLPYYIKRNFSGNRPLEDMLVNLVKAHS